MKNKESLKDYLIRPKLDYKVPIGTIIRIKLKLIYKSFIFLIKTK